MFSQQALHEVLGVQNGTFELSLLLSFCPCETEFANSFVDAQLDVERGEKNANKRRTMIMWRNAVNHTWATRPISEVQKLITRQPKIMQAIIDGEGSRTRY